MRNVIAWCRLVPLGAACRALAQISRFGPHFLNYGVSVCKVIFSAPECDRPPPAKRTRGNTRRLSTEDDGAHQRNAKERRESCWPQSTARSTTRRHFYGRSPSRSRKPL